MSMKYNFGEMLALAGDIRSNSGKLVGTHDELKGYVNGLVGQWESEARESYQAVQKQWDDAHNELIQVLNTIAKVVEDGTNDMNTTEGKNASSWA